MFRGNLGFLASLCLALSFGPVEEAASGEFRLQARADLVVVPAATFVIGDPAGEADETPRQVSVAAFRLMRHEVSNRLFAGFVAETGRVTDPEASGIGYVWDRRWRRVHGAQWRHPEGPGSDLSGLAEHPVVQVSARDAGAFCTWYGLRLPSEEEWEFAARGRDRRRYPWGDGHPDNSDPNHSNLGYANFGTVLCCAPDASDGYLRTAPVGSYPTGASPHGLLDMAGNVWEWTSSRFPDRPEEVVLRGGGWGNDPYCLRVSYRHGNPADIGLDMVGFRCAADGPD